MLNLNAIFIVVSVLAISIVGCGDVDGEVVNLSSSNLAAATDVIEGEERPKVYGVGPDEDTDEVMVSEEPDELCPRDPAVTDKVFSSDQDDIGTPFEDSNREFKDGATNIVVENFFQSNETLYNFMKIVYQNIDNALADYRLEKGLEDRSIFLLFKGGNVLRIVANEVFDLLAPDTRNFLFEKYAPYFKRSDADFSIYVDEEKLKGYDYDTVLDEVTKLAFAQLDELREEFESNPTRYFDLLRLTPGFAQQALGKHLADARNFSSINDQDNEFWHGADLRQLQFLHYRAAPGAICYYHGKHDYRFEAQNNKLITTRISDQPHWIANSENRNLQWYWGSDKSKLVKFFLVRSKVIFDYTLAKDDDLKLSAIGGELIDISLPHRDDDRLREFLANYDRAVSEYTLINSDGDDRFTLKAYSLANLAEDLQFIIFDSFIRPWEGGKKYNKRVNRLFFLLLVELIENYGLGSLAAKQYLSDVQQAIIEPAQLIYSPQEDAKNIAQELLNNAELLSQNWLTLDAANDFWMAFATFVADELVEHPMAGDQEGFLDNDGDTPSFLNAIKENLAIAKAANDLGQEKIDTEEIYEVEIDNLQ